MEHVTKIGVLAGTNFNFINLKNYEKMIAETIGCDENEFEVSRSNVYEKGKKQWRVVISSVHSSKEKIDQALIKMKQRDARA